MSIETSTSVMLQSLVAVLTDPESAVWGRRVAVEQLPEKAERPSVVISTVTQLRPNIINAPDAFNRVTVRCIAERIRDALDGQEEIERRLDDGGSQGKNVFPAFDEWVITDCTSVGAVFFYEPVPGGAGLYHAGHDYRVRMFRR